MDRREFLEMLSLPAISLLPLRQSHAYANADRNIAIGINATAADPADGYRIIEIAAIEIISRKITGSAYFGYVDSDRVHDRAALLTRGLTRATPYDNSRFANTKRELAKFLDGYTLILQGAEDHLELFKWEPSIAERASVQIRVEIKTPGIAKNKQPPGIENLFVPYGIAINDDIAAIKEAILVAQMYLATTA
jgi:DNA polymerase-3 subunit epsilon